MSDWPDQEEDAEDKGYWGDDSFEFTQEDEQSQVGFLLAAALIPVLLISLILSTVLGNWVFQVLPLLLIVGAWGYQIWIAYSRKDENLDFWRALGDRFFPGENGEQQMRKAAWVLFAIIVAYIFGFVFLSPLVSELRNAMFDWTIPWPSDW
jgi:undecaprenyl pyrophosphate phosphatase UppP